MHDATILNSGPGGLDHITESLSGQWRARIGAHPPPIALTEYSPIFMRSEACGAAQQYISFLWQTKFIGEAVTRGSQITAMNHFAARAQHRPCITWGAGLKRAPSDSYSLYSVGGGELGAADGLPFPLYYAFVLWNMYGGNVLHSARTNSDVSVYITGWTTRTCGVSACTDEVLNTKADGSTCLQRVGYLRGPRGGHKTEVDACRCGST